MLRPPVWAPLARVDDTITHRNRVWTPVHHPAPAPTSPRQPRDGVTDDGIDRLTRLTITLRDRGRHIVHRQRGAARGIARVAHSNGLP